LLALLKCRTVDPVVLLDSAGRTYTVRAADLPPARGDGAPASSLVDVQGGARILYAVAGRPETRLLVASSGGYGFLTTIEDMMSNRKAGRDFMILGEGETPIAPAVYKESAVAYVAAVSGEGRMVVFDISEMRAVSRGRGVIVMGLEESEKLVAVAVLDSTAVRLRGSGRDGKEKVVELSGERLAHYRSHRARKGRALPKHFKASGFDDQPG
jgi:topoisomerase-4 subunit A